MNLTMKCGHPPLIPQQEVLPRGRSAIGSRQSLRSTRHTMSKEEVCVDCGEAKRSAEARAAVPVVDGHGQLQLGACQPLYEAWTDCIKKKDNQASACAEVLKGFKACHARMSASRLEAPAPQ